MFHFKEREKSLRRSAKCNYLNRTSIEVKLEGTPRRIHIERTFVNKFEGERTSRQQRESIRQLKIIEEEGGEEEEE